MDRRSFLASGAAVLALSHVPLAARAQASGSAAAQALFERLHGEILKAYPQQATTLGVDKGPLAPLKSRLADRSYASRLREFRPLVEHRAAVHALDRSSLSGNELAWRDTVAWIADRSAEIDAVPYGGADSYGYPVPYVISQLTGSSYEVPDFLDSQHTVDTREDAEAYLSRLQDFARNLNLEAERARADAGRGVTPPDFIIDKALTQLNALAARKGEASGLAQSLARKTAAKGIAGDWSARAAALVDGPIAQGLQRQIAYLKEVRLTASSEAGVSRLPNGEAYYDLCLRFQTSADRSVEDTHKLGLEQMAELTAQIDTLLKGQGLTQGTVGARLTALTKDSRYLYPNTDAGREKLLSDVRHLLRMMDRKLPTLFSRLPKSGMEVRRVPPDIELGSPRGYAQSGSIDGSRPGAYYINLRDTAMWPRFALPTLTFHEGVPGHLFHGALVNETPGTPMLFKSLGFNAFTEGWALYSEQLADESGIYATDPVGRIGFLQSFLYRAGRIVVDTGMHAKGWSREKAVRYFTDDVGLDPGSAQSEIDRYCVWPGQACGYKIGHIEIVRLREKAKAALGARFDIKAFHDVVLLAGPMPLAVLEARVDAWTAQNRA